MPASKKKKKRGLHSEDPLSSKRAKTPSSHQVPTLPPTPDDPRSIASSAAPSRPYSAEVEDRTLASPACPGVIRNRDESTLLRLPPDSDVFETFAKLRKDSELSDEEAFFRFITTYDVPLETLNRISAARLPASFSNVKYKEIAPYVWLDPSRNGGDILPLDVLRSRIPNNLFHNIGKDVDEAIVQYGRLISHDTEEARSRFIASLFSKIVCLFGSAVVNEPEGLLDTEFTKKGRIKHHFYAMKSISLVFIEVKKTLFVGDKENLDIFGQVLAECAACDYTNSKAQHWVPILAILCDGESFEFIFYDSGVKRIYSSGFVTGLMDRVGKPDLFALSVKETTEYIFDYFLMAYINGLRSFVNGSNLAASRSISKKRASTEKWLDALAKAERADTLVRKAAVLASEGASEGEIEEAEEYASRGVDKLMESVELVMEKRQEKIIESCWDGTESIEIAMKKWKEEKRRARRPNGTL